MFDLEEEQLFYKQHHANFNQDGNLVLFDNHTDEKYNRYVHEPIEDLSNPPISRVLVFELDEDKLEVKNWDAYEQTPFYSSIMGSSFHLEDETFLIGWGGRETESPLFSVVDFKNKSVIFECIPVSGDWNSNIYRVYFSEK